MINGETFFDQPVKNNKVIYMKTLDKLLQIEETIAQQAVC